MGFWDFSLAVYQEKAVQTACLTAQDIHGADVNVLLYLLWLAADGQSFDAAGVAEIDAAVEPWRAAAVVPLRAARRRLKGTPLLKDGVAQEALRTKLKKVELEAERCEQELLDALAVAPAATGQPIAKAAAASLAAYAGFLGTRLPDALVAVFVSRLGEMTRWRQLS